MVFELYVECRDEDRASQIANHFRDFEFRLTDGRIVRSACEVGGYAGWNLPRTVVVVHSSAHACVTRLRDIVDQTETGIQWLNRLKLCPVFEFARVALEATLITMDDIKDYIEMSPDGDRVCMIQCVLSRDAYERFGRPTSFESFMPNYLWNGYYGESYRPLHGQDFPELGELYRRFFPSNPSR